MFLACKSGEFLWFVGCCQGSLSVVWEERAEGCKILCAKVWYALNRG